MEISSKLGTEELLKKLKEHSYPRRINIPTPINFCIIIGHFQGSNFVLNRANYWVLPNTFHPYFYGRVVPSETGSKIIGEFQINRLTKLFMKAYSILGAVGLAFLAWRLSPWPSWGWKAFLPFFAFYLFSFFVPRLFYNLDRDDLYLTEFLNQCAGDGKVTIKDAKLN